MIWGREREDWKEKMRLRNEESMRMGGWEGIGEPGRGRSKGGEKQRGIGRRGRGWDGWKMYLLGEGKWEATQGGVA